jgi:hypothetical protein
MVLRRFWKAAGAAATFGAIVLAGMLISSPHGRADDGNDDEDKVELGLKISPVTPNLAGRNRRLVGLGSFIVNAQADCNGCHSAGPRTEFAFTGSIPTGNPYLLKPPFSGKTKINPATYLGGGNDFGPLIPGSAHIVSRNLTPDNTGRPEGGHTFSEFLLIIRTGVDMDKLHPTCPTGTINANCIPAPFDGSRLQIMPWPIFANMTDNDLRAIYEYLSAIPCIDTIDPNNPQLRNTCK